jgi:hypothetical protein
VTQPRLTIVPVMGRLGDAGDAELVAAARARAAIRRPAAVQTELREPS